MQRNARKANNENHGKKWTAEDYDLLIELLRETKPIGRNRRVLLTYEEIANRLGRTFGSLVEVARSLAPLKKFRADFAGTILLERPLDMLRQIVRDDDSYDWRDYIARPVPSREDLEKKAQKSEANQAKDAHEKVEEVKHPRLDTLFDIDDADFRDSRSPKSKPAPKSEEKPRVANSKTDSEKLGDLIRLIAKVDPDNFKENLVLIFDAKRLAGIEEIENGEKGSDIG